MKCASTLDTRSLAAAAACGLLLGLACEKKAEPKAEAAEALTAGAASAEKDKQCCMGLNECKGQGGCAVPEGNDCAGKNECKGKGGCNMHCPKK